LFFNEAVRQEAIRAYNQAAAFHNPEHVSTNLTNVLKVHGPYTEGFFKKELMALGNRLNKKGG